MEEGNLLEKLAGFGLTRQEAAIYLCLYQNGEMTGYEASKLTGISRSNVYNGLSGLTEKGAVYRREDTASKYIAVDVEEFCANKIRRMEEDKIYLTGNLLRPQENCDGYFTVTGPNNIHDKAANMLKETKQRVYLSAAIEVIEGFRQQLTVLLLDGKKVVLLTDEDPKLDGAIFYRKEREENQLRLIVDSAYVLTGDAGKCASDTCLYTGQKNFVSVFKEALRNEIKLIELTRSRQ
ncbi:MAG: TrmB family transcriptional regulator [Lachnospiraceae bacterium]|nr:TrmB family transcriptional regulator [Lachnospiraceae bacterium]